MGWTETHRRDGQSVHDFLADEFHFGENATNPWKMIDSSVVRRTEFYAVAEYTAGPKAGIRFALVVLLRYSPKSHYNIGYKEMDESSLPYYFNCPARLLDKLSPVEAICEAGTMSADNATKWREGCRDVAAKRRVPIKSGDTVTFANEIGFTNGVKAASFTYVKGSLFCHPTIPGRFRITNWRDRDHTVIEKSQKIA